MKDGPTWVYLVSVIVGSAVALAVGAAGIYVMEIFAVRLGDAGAFIFPWLLLAAVVLIWWCVVRWTTRRLLRSN